ncbi:MAG: hypothetical protein AUK34_01130 [Ignavibacteria bacterium CG2_30_36_16]|nr:hypothetical protein [Ignavibacteria bacterium]OIP63684.1 MAG: hypothetical protein AUK34_01130 [Ignavibacteria bacterium CG2_30_36_16]PJB00929.1 MAG: hypothetical protein CO127_06435 [Ignavibacteria bacterium CG_4_9_14_3_um_filter_36_18]
MKTRQLSRKDLPNTRSSGESLHIPVLLNDKKRYICDIHFGNDELCYLENAKGVPTKINKLQLITDERSKEDIRIQIKKKQKRQEELYEQISNLQHYVMKMKIDLRKA